MMAEGTFQIANPYEGVLQAVAKRAGAADRGEITLAADIRALRDSGLLDHVARACLPGGDAKAGADALRQVGRASLSVGRIVEGHANALALIQLYGTPVQRQRAADAAAGQALFGVWGADGKKPVTIGTVHQNAATLSGSKQFCSGIGLVTQAVIAVETHDGPQLFVADVDDPARGDVSGWQVSGMRATASGSHDFTGVTAQMLGQARDYLREPHFEGGIWRYCAIHCGGMEALAEHARQHILRRGQSDNPLQRARLARLVSHAHTARLWVDASSLAVAQSSQAEAVPHALLAREAVEQACVAGITLTERIMGTAAFNERSDADRIRRDLAFFLRQADLDGKLDRAAKALLTQGTPVVGEVFS